MEKLHQYINFNRDQLYESKYIGNYETVQEMCTISLMG